MQKKSSIIIFIIVVVIFNLAYFVITLNFQGGTGLDK